ncbi:SEFIR domain-containing protein [Actinosynnema sp. NPDC020468]|uniref:SEFIR domain-containing protein n=1 Tax=Actinosynnema sp. NPDC020468 TaxID=3154488 RepID=UPI0033F0BF6B
MTGVPRLFVSYSHDSPDHTSLVRTFAHFLRAEVGLDVHLDQWYDDVRRDWSLWAVEHLRKADFILVVASPGYRSRADGEAPPDVGRGAQFEAAIIRDDLTRDLRRATERVLPVVLPGRSVEDIPTFLTAYAATRYHVPEFTRAGVESLLDAITGRGAHPLPERGEWLGHRVERAVPAFPTQRTVLLASSLSLLTRSPDVSIGRATMDDHHLGDSVLLRPSLVTGHVAGFVEFDLGRAYRRLRSVVGVPDDAAETALVGRFRVLLDGEPQPEVRAGFGRSAVVDVDVTDVRRLRLEMDRPSDGGPPRPWRARPPTELAWGDPTLFA